MTPNHGLEYPKCVVTQKGWYLLRRQIFISIYGAYRRVTGCDNYARAPRSWPWNQQYTYIYTTQSIPPPPSWRQSACPVPSLSSQCQARSSFNHLQSSFLLAGYPSPFFPPFFSALVVVVLPDLYVSRPPSPFAHLLNLGWCIVFSSPFLILLLLHFLSRSLPSISFSSFFPQFQSLSPLFPQFCISFLPMVSLVLSLSSITTLSSSLSSFPSLVSTRPPSPSASPPFSP